MTKKEKAIKDINIGELKANFRTIYFVSVFAALVIGTIGGYFMSFEVITSNQAKAIEVITQLKQ